MQPTLTSLIQTVAGEPDRVRVTQLTASPMVFRIQVAPSDFQSILDRLTSVKTLALSIKGLPHDQSLILQLDVI